LPEQKISCIKLVNINIEIPEDLHRKVKIFCAMQNITLKDFIISTLESTIKQDSKILSKISKEYGRKE